ncbi:RGS domain-containing protein [Umbelopsis sp. PMI_123]|nr:RGS domain-containing protein [Umbelopsis sp. PMI_123]
MDTSLYEPPIATPSVTLEDILKNNTSLAFNNFFLYLQQTYCSENLAFWLAVQRYKHCIIVFFDERKCNQQALAYYEDNEWIPKPVDIGPTIKLKNDLEVHLNISEAKLLTSSQMVYFNLLHQKLSQILTTFICVNAPQEINIPCDMREEILYHVRSGNLHPMIFDSACESVLELMRVNSFIPWLSEIVAREQELQKQKLNKEAREANRLSISSFRLRRLRSFSSFDSSSTFSKGEDDHKQRHKRMFQIIQRISRTLGLASKNTNRSIALNPPSFETTLMLTPSSLAVLTPPQTPVSLSGDRRTSWIWKR